MILSFYSSYPFVVLLFSLLSKTSNVVKADIITDAEVMNFDKQGAERLAREEQDIPCSTDDDCPDVYQCSRGFLGINFLGGGKCYLPDSVRDCLVEAARDFNDNLDFDEWITQIFQDAGIQRESLLRRLRGRTFEEFQRTNEYDLFMSAYQRNFPGGVDNFQQAVSDCKARSFADGRARDPNDNEMGYDTMVLVGINIEVGALFNFGFSAYSIIDESQTPTAYTRGTFGARLGGGGEFSLLVGIPFTKEKANLIGNGFHAGLDVGAGVAFSVAIHQSLDSSSSTLEFTFGIGGGAGITIGYTITGFSATDAPTAPPTRAPTVECTSSTNTFTVRHSNKAGEWGYFYFEECGETVNPTLLLERDTLYKFVQTNEENWFHPMGFAYGPDGALDEQDELEPGVAKGSDTSCASANTCPAPMYFKDGTPLGQYSNDATLQYLTGTSGASGTTTAGPGTNANEDFGLDAYEPDFQIPLGTWIERTSYEVYLKFDDSSFSEDFFYFCHIHQFMSGRIKLTSGGTKVSSSDTPELGYSYDDPGAFDDLCGTFGLDASQLPNDECPSRFVCEAGQERNQFSDCVEAMNCRMIQGMTTMKPNGDVALFIHQMIPHHRNAVNMAKLLLEKGGIDCEDLANEDDTNCVMQIIAREIIANQNAQIQTMQGVLETNGWDSEADADCTVPIL